MKEFILASSSPRRKMILERYIEEFKIDSSNVDEVIRDDESPQATVMANAYRKARSVADKYRNEIIIGADTVVFSKKILGKPKDRGQARDMLKGLSGRYHSVITGILVLDLEKNIALCDYEETRVLFRDLSDEIIDSYLSQEEYMDKAGSYAIQEKGEILVKSIEGSYSNVVGLPIYLLEKNLNRVGVSLLVK